MHPTLLHLGPLVLPTFGLLAAVGLMLALALTERTSRLAGLDPEKLWNATLFAVLAAFLLSRALLLGTHWQAFRAFPILILAVPSLTPTALLLTVVATLAWLWLRQIPIPKALDAWAPCATLVWFFLALGHFAEGSDPGTTTTLPWAIRLPGETFALHPVALYAALIAAALTLYLYHHLQSRVPHREEMDHRQSRVPHVSLLRRGRVHPGSTASIALILTGLSQFLLSFLRQPGTEAPLGLDALQWVALALILAGALLEATTRVPHPREARVG